MPSELWGGMPVDLLQACFAAVDPGGIERKFRVLADMNPAARACAISSRSRIGSTTASCWPGRWRAKPCSAGMSKTVRASGRWRVGDKSIRPERYKGPALVLVPSRDRIVPPASALALARALPNAETVEVDTGHIGMVTGALAPRQVYARLARWLAKLD